MPSLSIPIRYHKPIILLLLSVFPHTLHSFQISTNRKSHRPHTFHHKPYTLRTPTTLSSLQNLLSDLKTPTTQNKPRLLFVGGKGGVGKTTISSAIAVSLASDNLNDQKILIVSTDPAHSLGDALDLDLHNPLTPGTPIPLTDPLTANRLSACEVDPTVALDSFRTALESFDTTRLAEVLGVSSTFLESLGLREFSGLLRNPPPGLDELVALAEVLDGGAGDGGALGEYDVVIVDTAPTGHTLRLLALPTFLDGFLGKLIELRAKLSGLASTLQSLFGDESASQRAQAIDSAVEKLDSFKRKMSLLKSNLEDPSRTSFVVVTVPTKLSVAESERLITELKQQGVRVDNIVVNQLLGSQDNEELKRMYYERRQNGQQKWINTLRDAAADVSASDEFRRNGDAAPIAVTTLPYFDVELVGVPALEYVSRTCFADNDIIARLSSPPATRSPRFVICGGKGGVGKTTTSATLAVSLANAGKDVVIVSTDPAHSLGDALDVNLKGGRMMPVPTSMSSLSAMEIDPSQSLSQFKSLVDDLVGKLPQEQQQQQEGGLADTLSSLSSLFDTLPAGTDEVVALAKIVNILNNDKDEHDVVILDTAPTGHTLRMLTTPGFVAELIDRVLVISDKVKNNAAVNMMLATAGAGAGVSREDVAAGAQRAREALLKFQLQMYDLEDIFCAAARTEFLIVTIPTELAARESIRLLNDLTFESEDMPIKVRDVVVNQVLGEETDVDAWLGSVGRGQARCLEVVKGWDGLEVTEVEYLDTEPRGVFGLKALEAQLLQE